MCKDKGSHTPLSDTRPVAAQLTGMYPTSGPLSKASASESVGSCLLAHHLLAVLRLWYQADARPQQPQQRVAGDDAHQLERLWVSSILRLEFEGLG